MKNQYFGDTRDLFKYDLILELLSENKFLDRFSFIPMLTANELSSHGEKTNYDRTRAGTKRTELRNFLERCVKENRRNINELKDFFGTCSLGRKIEFTVYRSDEYFSHRARAKYFADVGLELLCRSLILIDPDVGLEVKSMKGREENYVKFSEVKFLFSQMDRNSVLVIFQFIPRVERKSYLSKIGGRLRETVNHPVLFISDNHIAFFVLTKDVISRRRVTSTIDRYSKAYGLITGKI